MYSEHQIEKSTDDASKPVNKELSKQFINNERLEIPCPLIKTEDEWDLLQREEPATFHNFFEEIHWKSKKKKILPTNK
jgi:hypothetical protein